MKYIFLSMFLTSCSWMSYDYKAYGECAGTYDWARQSAFAKAGSHCESNLFEEFMVNQYRCIVHGGLGYKIQAFVRCIKVK